MKLPRIDLQGCRDEEETIFRWALAFSFLGHAVLGLSFWGFQRVRPVPEPPPATVIYHQPLRLKKTIQTVLPVERSPSPKTPRTWKVLDKQPSLPYASFRMKPSKSAAALPEKDSVSKVLVGGEKRFVAIPVLDSEKLNNVDYSFYQNQIRNRIQEKAYHYLYDPRFESGEVYLTFLVNRQGRITQCRIREEKTRASDFLRQAALRSVLDAAPFAPFPKGLDFPELPFSVLISFYAEAL